MLVEEAGAALQLSPIKLGHELQAGPRRRYTPGDLLLVHLRGSRTFKPRLSVHGGLPISKNGLREATSLIALSLSPGRSKFHDWPPGPGR
eukprot:12374175-Alexandrium_andersonii.AAC.1